MSNVPRVQWGQVLNYVAYPLVFHTKKATCASCLGRRTNEGEKNSVQGPSVRCAAQMRRGLYSLWATRSMESSMHRDEGYSIQSSVILHLHSGAHTRSHPRIDSCTEHSAYGVQGHFSS